MPIDEEKIREIIREEMSKFDFSDRFVIYKTMQFLDGRKIQTGKTTGLYIGSATDQKLGFYNTLPIAQRSGSAQAAVSGTADSTYSANEVTLINDLVTLSNELRQALVSIGIIKGGV